MDALANGTLFPGLNLPFHVKVDAASPANSAAAEIQALEFVITELGLYLDTHQDDTEAFSLFQQYVRLAEEGRARYTAMYGPQFQTDAAKAGAYTTWLNDPWPWEYSKGRNNVRISEKATISGTDQKHESEAGLCNYFPIWRARWRVGRLVALS